MKSLILFANFPVLKYDGAYHMNSSDLERVNLYVAPFAKTILITDALCNTDVHKLVKLPKNIEVQFVNSYFDLKINHRINRFIALCANQNKRAVIGMFFGPPKMMLCSIIYSLIKFRLPSILIASGRPSLEYRLSLESPNNSLIDCVKFFLKYIFTAFIEFVMLHRSAIQVMSGNLGDRVNAPNVLSFSTITSIRKPSDRAESTEIDELITIGFVGRVSYAKGIDRFHDVISKLAQTDIKVRVIIVGKGATSLPDPVGSNPAIAEFALFEHVGPDLVWDFYEKMDFLFFPSREEGMPRVPAEAMSCGVIVLGMATGLDYYLRHNQNGLIYTHWNTDQIVQDFLECLQHKNLQILMRKNALKTSLHLPKANIKFLRLYKHAVYKL